MKWLGESEAELWCNFYPRKFFSLRASCLPSSLVKCELMVLPAWLQLQPALISWHRLHLSSPDLPCTRASGFPVSALAQVLLAALQFPDAPLFSSCWWASPSEIISSSYAVLPWPLMIPLAVCMWSHTHFPHVWRQKSLGAGGRDCYSNPASGHWVRSGASKRDLGTQKFVKYIMEQKV